MKRCERLVKLKHATPSLDEACPYLPPSNFSLGHTVLRNLKVSCSIYLISNNTHEKNPFVLVKSSAIFRKFSEKKNCLIMFLHTAFRVTRYVDVFHIYTYYIVKDIQSPVFQRFTLHSPSSQGLVQL